jgi:tetratricopeptide (TPR) repeat protein
MLVRLVAVLILAAPTGQTGDRPKVPTPFGNLSRQAEEARNAKRLDEALNLYKKALALKPDWEDGWWNAGSIAYDLDNYTECASDFGRLAALKPDSAPAWTSEGLCEYHLRDYDAALKSLSRVQRTGFLEQQDLSRAAMLHLALVLAKRGDPERAIVLLFRLSSIEQKTPEIIVAAGIAGLQKNWIPPEVPESEQDKVFKLGDAMATVMQRDATGAMEKFETAVRDYPKEPEIHYRFGAFLMEEDPERGIQELKKTLELEPAHIPARVALARIHLKRQDPQAALPYAQEAVRLGPGDFNTHVALGQVLLATQDTAGAARELELAVKLAPESPVAHYSLASAYAKMGRKEDAARERQEFERLRRLADSSQP